MEVRDNLNSLDGYKEIIDLDIKFIKEGLEKIQLLLTDEQNEIQKYPKPNLEVIKSTRDTILLNQYDLLKALYSTGETIENFKYQYLQTVESMQNVWRQSNGYVQMVMMLSIGIMLEVDKSEFDKLVGMVKDDNPKDFLIDFLIKSRISSWEQHEGFKFPKPYRATKEIVETAETDKQKALEFLKKYMQKEWYKSIETKTHTRKFNIHSGYWCFESGALVKILGFDDSSLKDQPILSVRFSSLEIESIYALKGFEPCQGCDRWTLVFKLLSFY